MKRTVTIPAQGQRAEQSFDYEAPNLKTLDDAVSYAGGHQQLIDLVYNLLDADATTKFLERQKLELTLIPKLAAQMRVFIDTFTKTSNLTISEAVERSISILVRSEKSPESYKSLTEDQLNEAIDLATAERKKRGRKPKEVAIA